MSHLNGYYQGYEIKETGTSIYSLQGVLIYFNDFRFQIRSETKQPRTINFLGGKSDENRRRTDSKILQSQSYQ